MADALDWQAYYDQQARQVFAPVNAYIDRQTEDRRAKAQQQFANQNAIQVAQQQADAKEARDAEAVGMTVDEWRTAQREAADLRLEQQRAQAQFEQQRAQQGSPEVQAAMRGLDSSKFNDAKSLYSAIGDAESDRARAAASFETNEKIRLQKAKEEADRAERDQRSAVLNARGSGMLAIFDANERAIAEAKEKIDNMTDPQKRLENGILKYFEMNSIPESDKPAVRAEILRQRSDNNSFAEISIEHRIPGLFNDKTVKYPDPSMFFENPEDNEASKRLLKQFSDEISSKTKTNDAILRMPEFQSSYADRLLQRQPEESPQSGGAAQTPQARQSGVEPQSGPQTIPSATGSGGDTQTPLSSDASAVEAGSPVEGPQGLTPGQLQIVRNILRRAKKDGSSRQWIVDKLLENGINPSVITKPPAGAK